MAIPPTGLSLPGMHAGALASFGVPGAAAAAAAAAAASRLGLSGLAAGGHSVLLVSNLNAEVSARSCLNSLSCYLVSL